MAESTYFRDVLEKFVKETGVAARQIALRVGLTDTAEQRWKANPPKRETLEKILGLVGAVDEKWPKLFKDAWDRDNTPEDIWREIEVAREAARARAEGKESALALAAEAAARRLPTPEARSELLVLLQDISRVEWTDDAWDDVVHHFDFTLKHAAAKLTTQRESPDRASRPA